LALAGCILCRFREGERGVEQVTGLYVAQSGQHVLFDPRLALFELGKERAKPALESLEKKVGDAPSARALRGLAWVVDPARSDEPPVIQATLTYSEREVLRLIAPWG